MVTQRTVLLALVLLLLPPACGAQTPEVPWTVDVGGGVGGSTHGYGLLLHAGVGTPLGDAVVRWTKVDGIRILEKPGSARDFALLYGRTRRGRTGWVRGALGVGRVEAIRAGQATVCSPFIGCAYEKVERRSTGLALQVDGVWTFSSPVGLGLTAFGNINSADSFGGIVLSLHFGRLRSP